MEDGYRTRDQLITELFQMRQRIAELERSEAELERTGDAVRLAHAELDQIVWSSGDSMRVVDRDFNTVRINEAFCVLSGIGKDEAVGKKCYEIFPGSQCDTPDCSLRRILGGEERVEHEAEKERIDGVRIPRIVTATPLRNPGGELIGIVQHFKDITGHKRMEEALRADVQYWETTFDAIGDAVCILDSQARILRCNKAMSNFLGKPFGEIIGGTCWELVHGRSAPIDECPIVRMRRTRHRETLILPIHGKWLDVVADPLLDEDGNLVGAVHIMADITERKQLEEALDHHTKRVEALYAVSQTVSQTLDLRQMLDGALERATEVLDVDAAYICTIDEAAKQVTLKAYKGISDEVVARVDRLKCDWRQVEKAMRFGEPTVAMRELFGQPKLAKLEAMLRKEGTESRIAVPLCPRGIIWGVMVATRRRPRELTPEDMDLLQAIANQIVVGIENATLFDEVSRSAITNGLTGLYNHRYFQDRLKEEVARVLRFGGECSLIMFDVDFFKMYNDLFGHLAGDEVLKRIGREVRNCTRQIDITCRYGGEEFAVILPRTSSDDAYEMAERLRRGIEAALSPEEGAVTTPLTISLGVTSCPRDALSPEDLIRSADRALTEAKERGRNQTCLASGGLGVTPTVEGRQAVVEHLVAAGLSTVYALAAAVDARDHYTYGHSRNVAKHAMAMGKALRLSRTRLERLRIWALLHDIGKIGLSDSVIRKPGPLGDEEWEMMKSHSELGATIVGHSPELADCAPAIRHHHEWWDGGGYPDGLKGKDIPQEARIIAIGDAYDTMTGPRAYRQMVSPSEAIDELRRCADTQFDSHLVETFARLVREGL